MGIYSIWLVLLLGAELPRIAQRDVACSVQASNVPPVLFVVE
jgi:hypothetical protein